MLIGERFLVDKDLHFFVLVFASLKFHGFDLVNWLFFLDEVTFHCGYMEFSAIQWKNEQKKTFVWHCFQFPTSLV